MGFFDKLKEWFHIGEEKEPEEAAPKMEESIQFNENLKPESVESRSDSQASEILADFPSPAIETIEPIKLNETTEAAYEVPKIEEIELNRPIEESKVEPLIDEIKVDEIKVQQPIEEPKVEEIIPLTVKTRAKKGRRSRGRPRKRLS